MHNHAAIHVPLATTPAQTERLVRLQATFACACNALIPIVRERRCWNRVALHHLAYHLLRARFPELGSQMVCNAIYSVSRVCRLLFQHPQSPWHIARLAERPLPAIEFAPTAPVYFDRHTLSVKPDGVSMYTLDGRMRFSLTLPAAALERFGQERLREIVLSRQGERFVLSFHLHARQTQATATLDALPEYVIVHETTAPSQAVEALSLAA